MQRFFLQVLLGNLSLADQPLFDLIYLSGPIVHPLVVLVQFLFFKLNGFLYILGAFFISLLGVV